MNARLPSTPPGAEVADTAEQGLLQFESASVGDNLGDLLEGKAEPGFGPIAPSRAGGTRLVEIGAVESQGLLWRERLLFKPA